MIECFESLYFHRPEIENEMSRAEEYCTHLNDEYDTKMDKGRAKSLKESMKVRVDFFYAIMKKR